VTVNLPSLEEKLAIARLKQGDLDGMEVLVKRYQVQAIYTAYLIVRDMKLAEDIVQDAYLRAAEKIAQFDEGRSFGPWFLRSVVHASIKAAERQKRLVPLDGDKDEEMSSVTRWLLDPEPGPDEIAETRETRRIVWKALGQLTPEQRAVIILRHFLEMNEKEITRELDRPGTTIHWWLRASRNRLREILRPFWQVDGHETDDERQE